MNYLLELKQKQASASEARSARKQQEDAAKQGRVIGTQHHIFTVFKLLLTDTGNHGFHHRYNNLCGFFKNSQRRAC
jgi:hypothetical protein